MFPEPVGESAQELLGGVISSGTGKAAQIPEFAFGKTGTTENYGDAWFVGSNKELTVAVWVGYPDRLTAMETEYHGGPVAGGTFPAEIWHDLMTAWIGIRDQRILDRGGSTEDDSTTTTPILPSGPATTTPAPEGEGTAPEGGDKADSDTGDTQSDAPEEPTPPQEAPTPTPPSTPPEAPAPTPAPGGGGTGNDGGAVAPDG